MIELSAEHERFVADQVIRGYFKEPSEVVSAALKVFQSIEQDYLETIQDIEQGRRDLEKGLDRPLAEVTGDIRRKLGLPK